MTRFSLLLLLLCAACFDARFGDPPALRATSAALSGLADAAENATVQARSEKAYSATSTAGALVNDLSAQQTSTVFAMQVKQTDSAATPTAQSMMATQTVEKMESIQKAQLSGIQGEAAAWELVQTSTLKAEILNATSTALVQEQRLDETRTLFMMTFPWMFTCATIGIVYLIIGTMLARIYMRTKVQLTPSGTIHVSLFGPSIPLDDLARERRLAPLLPSRSMPPRVERAEQAERTQEHEPVGGQNTTVQLLLKAKELGYWYETKIPGWRELRVGGEWWSRAIAPLVERGWVETSNQGTTILEGRNLGEIYYMYLETL